MKFDEEYKRPWDWFKTESGYQFDLPLSGAIIASKPVDVMRVHTDSQLGNHHPSGQNHTHYADFKLTDNERRVDDSAGYVYFIQDGTTGRIKIGKSENPEARLDSLQTANAGVLTLLVKLYTQNMGNDEKYYHKKFQTSHIRGEWFLPSQELLDFIEEEYDKA